MTQKTTESKWLQITKVTLLITIIIISFPLFLDSLIQHIHTNTNHGSNIGKLAKI